MASNTEIANLALGHLGIATEISTLESEKSAEALACRRYYEPALKATLRDYAWPFATKSIALGLVESDPTSEWKYSYTYPSDCVNFKKILSGTRNESRQSRVPFRIFDGESSRVIYTDAQDAEGEYTKFADDPMRYPEDFIMAFSYRLASYIAPRITNGDIFKVKQQLLALYQMEVDRARANSANEGQEDDLPDSEMIRARDF